MALGLLASAMYISCIFHVVCSSFSALATRKLADAEANSSGIWALEWSSWIVYYAFKLLSFHVKVLYRTACTRCCIEYQTVCSSRFDMAVNYPRQTKTSALLCFQCVAYTGNSLQIT